MNPRLRRILWRIEDNGSRWAMGIVGFLCVAGFWAMLAYTVFGALK